MSAEQQFTKGFTSLRNAILQDPELRAADLAVYWAACSFMYGKRTEWHPGYRALAERAHCSTKTARACVRRLEDRGWLIVHRGRKRGSSAGRPTHVIEVVQDREAFLRDRARRDHEHAERVQKEGHREGVLIQSRAVGGKMSKDEANRFIRQIQGNMNRRSPRVPVAGVAELNDEAMGPLSVEEVE